MPYFRQDLETMSRDQIHATQQDKVIDMLAQIDGKNRFYTAKFAAAGFNRKDFKSLDDLSKLPLTTKSELVQAQADDPPFGTNATFPETAYTRLHQTSGTTGVPLRVVDTEQSWDWWGHCWGFVLSGAGMTANDRLFLPFSFGPFIGFWASVEGARHIGALMIPGGGSNSVQRLHLMKDMKATALCATPTYALRLAEVAREEGIDLSELSIRATIHAGEPGANIPATKSRIEELWHAKCFDHAGASEVGAHSFECEVQPGGTHLIETEFIGEVIDPATGQPVEEGQEGELVITNLGRIGFPVIRYRTGDLVRATHEPCECGRTFLRFEGGVLGRADDMVIVRGVNVFPSALENIVRRFDAVDEYRATVTKQREMGELLVEVELVEGASADTGDALAQELQHSLGMRPTVKVVERGALPRFELKAKRFIVSQGD